jgi:hypothetical protein
MVFADSSALTSRPGSLPILFDDGVATATGFEDIIAYLRNHPEVAEDLDANLASQQITDKTAFVSLVPILKLVLTILIDSPPSSSLPLPLSSTCRSTSPLRTIIRRPLLLILLCYHGSPTTQYHQNVGSLQEHGRRIWA